MLLKEIEPFVRQAIVASLNINKKDDVFNELQTSDCRLFYITEGRGSMIISGQSYELKSGCAILFQSGNKYIWQVASEKKISFVTVNFDYTQNYTHIKKTFHPVHSENFSEEDILEKANIEDADILNKPIVLKNAGFLEDRLRLLTTEYYLGSKYCSELLTSILKSIVISIVRTADEKKHLHGSKDFELTRKIVQYIQKNYNQNISNEKIAQLFNYNSSYLNRMFKKHTGTSMHTFLLNYRLNMAMDMLRSKNATISEIVNMVGFSDLSHFTKTFKKHTGKTPTKFIHSNE